MAKRSPNKGNKETEQTDLSLGMEFMLRLASNYNEALELIDYMIKQFKCKARKDYNNEWMKDSEFIITLDRKGKDNHIPKTYKSEENKDEYKRLEFNNRFYVESWKVEKYDDNSVSQFIKLKKKAVEYLGMAKLKIGCNKFGNNKEYKADENWLICDGKNGELDWKGYIKNPKQKWIRCFFSVVIAMYVCSDGITDVWDETRQGVKNVSPELIEGIKKETESLIKDMGIKEPPSLFFSSAENMMCLLLTAFRFDSAMTDDEKESRRKKLLGYVMGEGTDIYNYRKLLWDNVAAKTELSGELKKIISEYYVLPTLNKITTDNGVLRCQLEAPIGFGKTSFNRAILTCMLRNYVKDERIEKEKESLDALEKQIRETWADIELSNYFPVYVNALLINDNDDCKDILEKAEGNEYAKVIRQNVQDGAGSKALLIVDGLDEVNDAQQRKTLAKLIDSFIKKYNKVNYIVTSRPIDLSQYEDKGLEIGKFFDGIQKVTIQALNDNQKKAIIDKWVNVLVFSEADAQQRSEEIKGKIEKSPYFSDLSCNPFLLARSVQLMVKPDHTQYEIMSQIVNSLIEKKLYSFLKDILDISDGIELRRVLSCLAYNCVINNEAFFDWKTLNVYYSNAYRTVAEEIRLTKDEQVWSGVFKEINTKAGLIVYDGEEKEYQWQSETLELFLAAEWALLEFQYLIEKNGKEDAVIPIREQLDKLRKNERWEDIFIMMLVGWDKKNSEFDIDCFRMVITIIIKYLLDLSITLETELIRSIGHIMLICCLKEYANCYKDIIVDENKKYTKNLKLMLRFIAQNAKIIADIDRIKMTNENDYYKDAYDQLYRQGLIGSMIEYEER